MGSVACNVCGYVRWTAASRCPACGAITEDIPLDQETDRPRRRSGGPRLSSIDAAFRVEDGTHPRALRTDRNKRAVEVIATGAVVIAIAVLIVSATDPNILQSWGLGAPTGPAPQLVIENGTTL